MSPTIFRSDGFRFYLYSQEESRIHVHVRHAEGEAKFWLDPAISVARSSGLNSRRLTLAERLIRSHEHEIRVAWAKHFTS